MSQESKEDRPCDKQVAQLLQNAIFLSPCPVCNLHSSMRCCSRKKGKGGSKKKSKHTYEEGSFQCPSCKEIVHDLEGHYRRTCLKWKVGFIEPLPKLATKKEGLRECPQCHGWVKSVGIHYVCAHSKKPTKGKAAYPDIVDATKGRRGFPFNARDKHIAPATINGRRPWEPKQARWVNSVKYGMYYGESETDDEEY